MFIERLLKGLHLMMPGLCRTDDPKAKASPRNGLKFSRDAGCARARCSPKTLAATSPAHSPRARSANKS